MSDFLKALHSGKVLLMDGAMGTELQRAGIGEGECYEVWNLTHPEKIRAIHQAYIFAGARCLLANTFQANRCSLAKHGLQEKLEEINEAGVRIARLAAGVKNFVLGDIGPDQSGFSDEDIGQIVRSLRLADGLLLETWPDPSPCLFILKARDQKVIPDGLPILVSFTYRKNSVPGLPRIVQDPRAMASGHGGFGISALGVNCGRDLDMDDIIHIVKECRAVTDLPIFVRPNAGTPKRVGNHWEYPITPAMMADGLPKLLEAGVSMVGGCCGTTPEHIAAFRPIIDQWNARKK
jgi:5-methyltetrahydrofolate--homocysteine methyltransferase